MRIKFIAAFLLATLSFLGACKKDKPDDNEPFNDGCYPPAIAEIMVKKCATAGCHNTISKDAASGLDLSTWETMFAGNRNGATTIPYRSDQSTLFYFVNTDTTLGVVQQPTMPYNMPPLTMGEILTIKTWIDMGAPNCSGQVKFANSPSRKKFYVANQGCDLVGVHDAATKLVMRYIDVGNAPFIESPHMVRVSPDGQFWYVSFINSNVFQKFRTSDDTFVDEVDITFGSWNTFAITGDGSKAYVVDFTGNGRIAYINLDSMTLEHLFADPGTFQTPHGSALSTNGNTLYVTKQIGNSVYKFDLTSFPPDYDEIQISPDITADPHEVAMSPDGTKYFVTCQGINEVRVFDASNDAFIAAIPTASLPLEIAFSPSKGYAFVSCQDGNAVTVININTLTAIKNINIGYEPHGIAVDEIQNKVYVANRNTPSSGGPTPHHTSNCGGAQSRNGYLTLIDMNTLEIVPNFKMELSVDPYSVSIRN